MRISRTALTSIVVAALCTAGLFLFYKKYVPFVLPFQALYLPLCLAAGGITAWNIRTGTLAFLFSFPLVNNWPYFFRMDENTPHAPLALGLFLFYILGRLVHRDRRRPAALFENPVFRPLSFAAGLVVVSALITAWRFANFFPFLSGGFYELVTNVKGVTAGGARMSTVFTALNHLTGMAFFAVLCGLLVKADFRKQAVTVLWAGLLTSTLFGFFQLFVDPALGNTAFWVNLGQINATFKDPNAFGAVLAAFAPLALGTLLHFRGALRILSGTFAAAALLIYPFIGARSGVLGLLAGLLWVGALSVIAPSRTRRTAGEAPGSAIRRKPVWVAAAVFGLLAVILGVSVLEKARLFERLFLSARSVSSRNGIVGLSPERYFLWKAAVSMIRDYPLTGVGAGAYIIELPNYYTKDKTLYPAGFKRFRRIDSAENYFLQVGSELGLLGLLAFLWLLGTVFREVGRGFRDGTAWGANRFLFWGSSGGLLSYVLNIFFHSYVGSFESVFGFWFLAAFLLTLKAGGNEDAPRGDAVSSVSKRPRTFLFFAAVLFLYGGIHAWNSWHSLSLEARTAEFHLRQDFGLYRTEKTLAGREFRWTREYGGMALKIEGPVIRIPLLAAHPDLQKRPVDVELFWFRGFFKEKVHLGSVRFETGGWTVHEFPLSDDLGRDGILVLAVSRTWIPLKTNGSPDPRRLGVAIGTVTFRK